MLADAVFSAILGANVDKDVCTRWVGETYLEALAPTASAAAVRTDFLNAWKDHLPESWRSEASLSALTVSLPPLLPLRMTLLIDVTGWFLQNY